MLFLFIYKNITIIIITIVIIIVPRWSFFDQTNKKALFENIIINNKPIKAAIILSIDK